MKRFFALICVICLICLNGYAENNNSPLGLYSMMGDFIGIGMNRASIEKVLGKALNEPFAEPSVFPSSFVDYDVCGWLAHSPLTQPSRGYYCIYAGDVIVQYSTWFSTDELCNDEPIYKKYIEMGIASMEEKEKYDESDWKDLYPELVELNDRYADMAEEESIAILIGTIGFEYSTHDGIYVGKKGTGVDLGVRIHDYTDIEEYYFVNQSQYREITKEQVRDSISSEKYNRDNFCGVGISVQSNDGTVEEICIKRMDAGNTTYPCDYSNRYENLLDYTKSAEQLALEEWQETLNVLEKYIISQNGYDVEFDYELMLNDYLVYENEYYTIRCKEETTYEDISRELELNSIMADMKSSGEMFSTLLRINRLSPYIISISGFDVVYDYDKMADDYMLFDAEYDKISIKEWDERTNYEKAYASYLLEIQLTMLDCGEEFKEILSSKQQ